MAPASDAVRARPPQAASRTSASSLMQPVSPRPTPGPCDRCHGNIPLHTSRMHVREFQLERYFARWEFKAEHLMSSSDCEAFTVAELLALAGATVDALAGLRLGYTESQGDPTLRARIAGFYPGLDADDVVVTNAPEEAIFLFALAALAPGDRVVVQTPCYQS